MNDDFSSEIIADTVNECHFAELDNEQVEAVSGAILPILGGIGLLIVTWANW